MALAGWEFSFDMPWSNKNDAELPNISLFRNIEDDEKLKRGKSLKKHIEKVVDFMYLLLYYDKVKNAPKGYQDFVSNIREFDERQSIKEMVPSGENEKNLLLYTALYHDIGKIVIKARHGSFGGDIIKNSGRVDRLKFFDLGFANHNQIFLMSDLIRFHDYFGTLQTGEASYLLFVEVLYPITNNSLLLEEHSAKRFLNYLLLINMADTLASIESKEIKEVLSGMIHDHKALTKIDEDIVKETKKSLSVSHTCDQDDFGIVASRKLDEIVRPLKSTTEIHTYERLRRILRSGYKTIKKDTFNKYQERTKEAFTDEIKRYDDQIFQVEEWFRSYKCVSDLSPIMACLRAIKVRKEFYTEFAFICKLDYGLGFVGDFLEELIKAELLKSDNEIKSPHDLRRDLSMCVVELMNRIVETHGHFTSNETRIGIGLERLSNISGEEREKLIKRLKGEKGSFKKAEAYAKIISDVNLWIIKP
ncbi:MAG: hypothetical protein O8C63_14125 [Candidatus Methanoperedens sp.]|nr:hypothetical protein [Candidatus Methanoperedens sp.]